MKLAASRIFLLVALAAIGFSSCQKEVGFENGQNGTGSGKSIVGDYDFVNLSATTLSTVSVTDAGSTMKSVTTSQYTSENNGGTVKITDNQIIYNNVKYDVNADATAKTYIDGVFIDEITMPFNVSMPPFSQTTTYVRNNQDSLTITGASVVNGDPTGGTPNSPTQQNGARISWASDTLLLKIAGTTSTTIDQGGTPVSMVGSVNGIIRLKKKG